MRLWVSALAIESSCSSGIACQAYRPQQVVPPRATDAPNLTDYRRPLLASGLTARQLVPPARIERATVELEARCSIH
jgi:hypothetical protein